MPLDKGKKIKTIEYLPSELTPRTPFSKDTIVDVRCEETGGRKFIEAIAKPGRDGARPSHKCANAVRNRRLGRDGLCPVRNREGFATASIVEMQMNWSANFEQRVLFNAEKAYVKQMPKGRKYHLLQPVYSLNLVNDTFEPAMDTCYFFGISYPEKVGVA